MKIFFITLSGGVMLAKEWCSKHRNLIKRILIGSALAVGICVAMIIGLYIYLRAEYPTEIDLNGVYTDLSVMNFEFSDRDLDATYEEDEVVDIRVVDGVVTAESEKVEIDENRIIIKAEGTYVLAGQYDSSMVIVETSDTEKVQLVLDGCNISNENGPGIYIKSADKVFITLAEGTVNEISDGKDYEYTDGDTNVDAAVFSRADLTINGAGELVVEGNYKHGIVSKDDLVIGSGIYDITSVKKAVNGKDCVKIFNCNMVINAGTDGICSDNEEDSDRGYIYICNGNFDITSGNDGLQAETVLCLEAPKMAICAGGGSANAPVRADEKFGRSESEAEQAEAEAESAESVKGLKAGKDVIIIGGEYNIDTVDDSIHANVGVKIEDGTFELKSGDDGIHADNTLHITGGKINIHTCYEGLEAYQIAIAGGETYVISSDDGVNASAGNESLSMMENIKRFFVPSLNGKLEITEGILAVNTEGDGLDSNGVMTINGGKTYVAGPTDGGNDAFDCDHMTVNVSETNEGESFVIEISKEEFVIE